MECQNRRIYFFAGKNTPQTGAAQMKNILIVFGVALYVFSPIDLIPDFPVIGWFDDLAVVGYGAQSVFGPEKKKRKKKRRPQNVIDVE
jgi:uncharacterized membrane protein YkvA (DUF1232 family)